MKQFHGYTLLGALLLGGVCSAASAQDVNEQPKPNLGAITVGYTFLYADQGHGERADLKGWFARPSVNFGRSPYSIFSDFTNYYGVNSKGAVNSHGETLGLNREFLRKAKVRPSLFVEAGNVRASNAGSIVNQFDFNVGGSLAVPLTRIVSIAFTPGEYIFLYPQGDIRSDYNFKIGLSFNVPRF